jgi:excisionase family DNA binding protein
MDDDAELLTVSQAAKTLNATSQTIRNWIRADRLRATRIGNRFLIPRAEVERFSGEYAAPTGDSAWDITTDTPPQPLRRRAAHSASADPADGLLGA